MPLAAKFYHFPGSHLKDLPENIFKYLAEDYGISRDAKRDEIPDRLTERSLLVVENGGEIIFARWDGGEPEDQIFSRDLDWIAGIIQKAHELGKAAPGAR